MPFLGGIFSNGLYCMIADIFLLIIKPNWITRLMVVFFLTNNFWCPLSLSMLYDNVDMRRGKHHSLFQILRKGK